MHLCRRDSTGRVEESCEAFSPYLWAASEPLHLPEGSYKGEALKGNGELGLLLHFVDSAAYAGLIKDRSQPGPLEVIRLQENQFLLEQQVRLFGGLSFNAVRRLQLDIETVCSVDGGFSDARRAQDFILAIGLCMGDQVEILEIEELTGEAERGLLKSFARRLRELDPDVVEGHNIFNFDLNYLWRRTRRYRLKPEWGRFGQEANVRKSRLRVAERWLDFTRMDIPGRTVFDTYLMIQVFDVTTRDLPSYGLKDVARRLGVTAEDGAGRTYLDGGDIQVAFLEDRDQFRQYLEGDLRETAGIADILLPTYLAQVQDIPMLLQDACLRGTANKVEMLFLDRYFHARHSLPPPPRQGGGFEGGYTRSFETGVFRQVLHYDVASLYPSILLHLGRNPAHDPLGAFLPLLRDFRQYRLEYKKRAREETDPDLQQEFEARQASYKILINSFYGYLGFPGARFGDPELAAEVTARGREFLQGLIEEFRKECCTVLEADTDGIYIHSERYWQDPIDLLERVKRVLPDGIDLEFNGSYPSMFCYKAKNYALYDGKKVTIRGSALRSRGIEPFLKDLTGKLIAFLLDASTESPVDAYRRLERQLESQQLPVAQLAKSEYLSMSPAAYERKMEQGGKPRRAALEVALARSEPLKAGDAVSYYVQPSEPGRTAAWQRARAVEDYDPDAAPYDPQYYKKKLREWWKRYEDFLPPDPAHDEQTEMSLS